MMTKYNSYSYNTIGIESKEESFKYLDYIFNKLKEAGLEHPQIFVEGSDEERKYLDTLKDESLKLTRWSFFKVDKKSLFDYPYYFLDIKENKVTKDLFESNMYLDFSETCNFMHTYTKGVQCLNGLKQKKKIFLDPEKTKKLDIMTLAFPFKRYILVSRKFKDIIQNESLKGAILIPCLKKGKNYTEKEMSIDSISKQLEDDADFFQLEIIQKVKRSPDVGDADFNKCGKCGINNGRLGGNNISSGEYKMEYFADADFQFCDSYFSTKVGEIPQEDREYIVSSKVIKIIEENKLKGWDKYWDNPKIKYGPVFISDFER